MANLWDIAGYTATIEAATHEGRDGYDWRIAVKDGTYSKGGWEPSEAEALRACLGALALGWNHDATIDAALILLWQRLGNLPPHTRLGLLGITPEIVDALEQRGYVERFKGGVRLTTDGLKAATWAELEKSRRNGQH